MKHARLSLFALTVCSLVLGVFVVSESAQAAVCTYRTRNVSPDATGNRVNIPVKNIHDGVDIPFCSPGSNQQSCESICINAQNLAVTDCAFYAQYNSCDQFNTAAVASYRQQEAERQAREAELQERRKADREAESGQCLCQQVISITNNGKQEKTLREKEVVGTPTSETCNDEFVNNHSSSGGNQYENCEWILNEDVPETFQKSGDNFTKQITEAEIEAKFNGIKSQARSLNKLKANSVQNLIGDIIRIAMGVMGSIALIMCIYGGFLWMTATGNASRVEKAQDVLIWGALGIFIILGSYALIEFVFEAASTTLTY